MNHENVNPFERQELPIGSFVVASEIIKGSPAEIAGMKKGDIILAINGQKISLSWQIPLTISMSDSPELKVQIERDGMILDLPVKANGVPGAYKIGVVIESALSISTKRIINENGEANFKQVIALEDELGNKIGEAETVYEVDPTVNSITRILSIVLKVKKDDGSTHDYDILKKFNTSNVTVWQDNDCITAGKCSVMPDGNVVVTVQNF